MFIMYDKFFFILEPVFNKIIILHIIMSQKNYFYWILTASYL